MSGIADLGTPTIEKLYNAILDKLTILLIQSMICHYSPLGEILIVIINYLNYSNNILKPLLVMSASPHHHMLSEFKACEHSFLRNNTCID